MDNRIDAIYGRQSIDKKDSISIESQFEFCRYELKGGEAKEYKDKGYSGKNIERPDFQRLLKDIKTGLIRRVIVYRLDRISRSIVDFAKLMELFKQYNVEFVSCTEKFDTSTPMGRAMLNSCIVFAQLKRESIQMCVPDRLLFPVCQGLLYAGPRSITNTSKPRARKSKAPELFTGDYSCYLYQGREGEENILVIAPHKGCTPSALWLNVQHKLSQNITFQNGRKCHNTWLAGKIKCGCCGYELVGLNAANGVTYIRCRQRVENKSCPGPGTLTRQELEKSVYDEMVKKMGEIQTLRGGKAEGYHPKLTAARAKLAKLDNISGYLKNWDEVSFDDKRRGVDTVISRMEATSTELVIHWKI